MKNLEFNELSMQELVGVNGGSWIGDAIDWIGEKLSQIWEFMKEHGLKDGRPGVHS